MSGPPSRLHHPPAHRLRIEVVSRVRQIPLSDSARADEGTHDGIHEVAADLGYRRLIRKTAACRACRAGAGWQRRATPKGTCRSSGPPACFTPDWHAAHKSAQRLAALEPQLIVPGHGRAFEGTPMRMALHQLADRFQAVAVPKHGRDVNEEPDVHA